SLPARSRRACCRRDPGGFPHASCCTSRVVAVAEPSSELRRLLDEKRRELGEAVGGQSGRGPGDREGGERVAAGTEDGSRDRRQPELELVDRRRVAARADALQLGLVGVAGLRGAAGEEALAV